MDWIIFALLAPILWAGCNIIDKFLLTKYFKNAFDYQLWIVLTDAPIIVFFLMFFPLSFSYPGFLLGIILGIMDVTALFIYNKAMLVEEVSRVIPLSYIDVLFILPMAYFFFGEVLKIQNYIGIILLLMGAILISLKVINSKKRILSPALKFVLILALLWAILGTLEKYTLGLIEKLSIIFWMVVGTVIGASPLFLFQRLRSRVYSKIKNMNWIILLLTIIVQLLAYSAFFVYLTAMSEGLLSLVVGISLIQPFIVFLFTTTLTLLLPKVIKEKIDRSTLFLKFIAICLIFVGAWLVMI